MIFSAGNHDLGARNCMVQQDFTCKNFQPPDSPSSFHLLHVLSVGKCTFDAKKCMGQQAFHYELFCRKFQPSKRGFKP